MKTVIIVLGLLGLAAPPAATDVAKEREEGFRPLFNGKDTTGWHLRNPRGHNSWTVEEWRLEEHRRR